MEQLTASNILRVLAEGYNYAIPNHQDNGIEMGVDAFIIYKTALSNINPNLSLPVNYFGTIIEVNGNLSPETINFYLKTK